MDLHQIATFALVASLLVMSPGPNGLLIARTVPTSGRAAGLANVAGFVSAFFVQGSFAIFGIAAILMRSAEVFAAVKLIGAGYLIWIGFKALRDAWQGRVAPQSVTPLHRRRRLVMAYGEGLLTNLLNPKTAMFYMAAFPQFLTAGQDTVMNAYLLVLVHGAINALWFGAMVLLFDRMTHAARGARFQRGLKAVTGAVFIGFGLKLASLQRA